MGKPPLLWPSHCGCQWSTPATAENQSHFFPVSHSWVDDVFWAAFCLHLVSTAWQSFTFSIQSDNNSAAFRKKVVKRGNEASFEGFNSSCFTLDMFFSSLFRCHWERIFEKCVLAVSFRAKIENCLCGKNRSGTWSVVVIGPVNPITDLPRAKSVRGHPPPPMDMLPVWALHCLWARVDLRRDEREGQGWDVYATGMGWEGMCKQKGRIREQGFSGAGCWEW